MKIKKGKTAKIILLLLVIILFNYVSPANSYAGVGAGVFTKPICWLVIRFMDSINSTISALFTEDNLFHTLIENLDKDHFITSAYQGYYDSLMSPDKIFTGKVTLLNANIFKAENVDGKFWELLPTGTSLASALKNTVSNIYVLLRNIAAVILLCLLIYTGIRILIMSASPYEQAKWKSALIDWVKALCLLMFMHLIMIGVFYISDILVSSLSQSLGDDSSIVAAIRWNFNSTSFLDGTACIINTIMYVYVTYLTLVFFIAYFKRFVWIIILILISPFVAVTYALGNKQSGIFNKWLKEYIFTVLLQPFHLLIFFVLVALPLGLLSGGESATIFGQNHSNMMIQIYVLLSIGMIRPAEKFLMNLFGFSGSSIAKQGSSESGVKTIKVVTDGIKEVAGLALQAGLAVATGGAAMAAKAGAGASGAGLSSKPGIPGTNMPDILGEGSGMNLGKKLEGSGENDEGFGLDNSLGRNIDNSPGDSVNNNESADKNSGGIDENEEEVSTNDQLSNAAEELTRSAEKLTEAAEKLEDASSKDNNEVNQEPKDTQKIEIKGDTEFDVSDAEFDRAITPPTSPKDKLMERLQQSQLYGYMTSPDARERFNKLKENTYEFRDSFYLDGEAPGEWKSGVEKKKGKIEQAKKDKVEAFVNNKNNINYMVQKHGLLEGIENCKTEEQRTAKRNEAEGKAKEILKTAAPYVNNGMSDIAKIDRLLSTQAKKGETPLGAMGTIAKVEYIATSKNKLESMQRIIASGTGERSNSPRVVQEARNTMQQAKPYIEEGKTDTQILHRLVQLENGLKSAKIAQPSREPQKVIKMDKVINEAMKKGLSQIKITDNKSSVSMKQIETVMNKELMRRVSVSKDMNVQRQATISRTTTQSTTKTKESKTKTLNPGENKKN